MRPTELENWHGEPVLAARWRRLADTLGARVSEAFWNEERGLFSDGVGGKQFSEHAQCLAILADRMDAGRRAWLANSLFQPDNGLARTTIYFTHYLFEACRLLGRPDGLLERLGQWFDLPSQGFKTTPEQPEPCRSDCHAWGAHPLYHYFTTILGIRPVVPGFAQVEIRPQPGPLRRVRGTMPHPGGEIAVSLIRLPDDSLDVEGTLPAGVRGTLVLPGGSWPLGPGAQRILAPAP